MKRIPLDRIKPGMKLAEALLRHDGVLLCQQGAELTEQIIRMLERMNIDSVSIEEEQKETPEEKAARLSQEEAALIHRFSRVASDPILVYLRQSLLKRLRGGN